MFAAEWLTRFRSTRARSAASRNDGEAPPDWERLFEPERLARHFDSQLSAAPFNTDPTPHTLIENVLPDDVYAALVRWIPPVDCFSTADPIKQNVDMSKLVGRAPAATVASWTRIETEWLPRVVLPALMRTFAPYLRDHYRRVFGEELAEEAARAPHQAMGRFMLRRPGYRLKPHRDPLVVAMTALWYVARPGDSEAYGTQLYRVEPEVEPDHSKTFYPPEERCVLVRKVPFRANAMLVFLNSRGAHAAAISRWAPARLERYAYQSYLRLPDEALLGFVRRLPSDVQARWRGKYGARIDA